MYDLDLDVEDDASTKFYKARLKRYTSYGTTGTTPIYNFDTWSREHYGSNFQRRKAAKEKFNMMQFRERENVLIMQNEIVLFSMLLIFCIITYLKFLSESSLDTPKQINNQQLLDSKSKEVDLD